MNLVERREAPHGRQRTTGRRRASLGVEKHYAAGGDSVERLGKVWRAVVESARSITRQARQGGAAYDEDRTDKGREARQAGRRGAPRSVVRLARTRKGIAGGAQHGSTRRRRPGPREAQQGDEAKSGRHVVATSGCTRECGARQAWQGFARSGVARQGADEHGRHGCVRSGEHKTRKSAAGTTWMARPRKARRGSSRQATQGAPGSG